MLYSYLRPKSAILVLHLAVNLSVFFSFNFHFLVSLFENGACLTSVFCLSIHDSQIKVPNKTCKRPKRGEILGLLDQGVCNT